MTNTKNQKLAKWEKPELVSLNMELTDIETQYNLGTDALMFGLSTSQS